MKIDPSRIFQSKIFKIVLWGIGAVAVLLLVFKAGTLVGFKKAEFSYRMGEKYYRSFAGPREGFPENMRGRDFPTGHGTLGEIIKISSSTLVIKDIDGTEKEILISDKTSFRSFREEIRIGDLKLNDRIAVIGSPNEAGQIEAGLIRIIP